VGIFIITTINIIVEIFLFLIIILGLGIVASCLSIIEEEGAKVFIKTLLFGIAVGLCGCVGLIIHGEMLMKI